MSRAAAASSVRDSASSDFARPSRVCSRASSSPSSSSLIGSLLAHGSHEASYRGSATAVNEGGTPFVRAGASRMANALFCEESALRHCAVRHGVVTSLNEYETDSSLHVSPLYSD